MPAKRRNAKRRLDPVSKCEAWAMTFKSGYDFLRALDIFDIHTDEDARAAAPAAWARLAHIYFDKFHEPDSEPWALTEFGMP